jgi:NTE family protein
MYYRRIVRGGIFDGAYGGVSLEIGNYVNPLVPGNASGVLKSMALFVAADSPVGPAYLGYGRAADGTRSFYFFLGRPL